METCEKLEHQLRSPAPAPWRMITLTLKSTDEPLADQLANLEAAFRRLRQMRVWKATQIGGRSVIEITYNVRTEQWHPHLHVLTCGKFLAQETLARMWKRATGGSYVVDIRAIKNAHEVANYLSSYLGKPPALEGAANPEALWWEHWTALRKKQMLKTFGKCPEIVVPREPGEDEDTTDEWEPLGSLNVIVYRAERGDVIAQNILAGLAKKEWSELNFQPAPT